jgi:hypothetical protein
MDRKRIIPVGGINPYANHPGFEASGCRLRYTVTPARSGSTSSHGFGCWFTGGHCVPGDHCDYRLENTTFNVDEEWYGNKE